MESQDKINKCHVVSFHLFFAAMYVKKTTSSRQWKWHIHISLRENDAAVEDSYQKIYFDLFIFEDISCERK